MFARIWQSRRSLFDETNLLFLCFACLPFVIHPQGADIHYGPKYVFAICASFAIFLVCSLKREFNPESLWVGMPLAGYAGLLMVSFLANPYKPIQLFPLFSELVCVLFAFLAATRKDPMGAYRKACCGMILAALVLGPVGVMRFVQTRDLPSLTLGSSTPLSHILLICGCLLLFAAPRKEWLKTLGLGIVAFGLAAAMNRWAIGILGCLCLLQIAISIKRRCRSVQIRAGTGLALLAAFTVFSRYWVNEDLQVSKPVVPTAGTISRGLTGRKQIYGNAFRFISNNPVWGTGAGGFHTFYPHYDEGTDTEPQDFVFERKYAHSHWLHLAAEHGSLSVGAFLFLLVWAGVVIRRRVGIGAIGSADFQAIMVCAAILLHASLDMDLQMPVSALFFWMSLGFLMRPAPEAARPASPYRGAIVHMAILSGLGIMMGLHLCHAISDKALLKAERISMKGKWQEAQDVVNAAEKWFPWNPALVYAKGYYLNAMGKYREAHDALTRSSVLGPLKQKAMSFYAANALSMDEPVLAQRIIAKGLDWDRENFELVFLKANLHFEAGELDSAEYYYREIMRKSPHLTAPRFRLAQTQVQRGNMPEARRLLEEVLKTEPWREEARAYLNSLKADP